MKKEALLYDKLNGNVNCHVCARTCIIAPKKRGFCQTRENMDGKLYTLIYAATSSVAVDPIEKKPLFHFYPGSTVFSLGTVGCNFRCKHCQNWTISQTTLEEASTREILPEEAIRLTKEYGCKSIAWTYNEPTIWLEYTYDTAKLAKKEDIKTVYVTNGYMTEDSFELMEPYLDAANIDLKGMSDKFYKELCSARLQPVLDTIKRMYENKIHIEITNLIIPGYNDSEELISDLVKFMVDEVGVEVPLHFTRFFPYYKLNHLEPTPVKTLQMAQKIAKEAGMKYVYIGNVPTADGENTYCPECGELLIDRNGFQILDDKIKKSKKCTKCGAGIDILI
ncbi:MAG: AmmeMemoRadiSam system radical SAM enzyme [Euryarchaeota archaeon]|nr:AmmeMemoRadiSam system radical SAM enzyme [Euryarchaeota archaeon]